LWLLGMRNHRAAARRRVHPTRVYKDGPLGHWASIAAPWRAQESPGPYRLIAALCGVSDRTAKRWMACPDELPSSHARRLAEYVRKFDGPAVARELETYAAVRDARAKTQHRRVRRLGVPIR
jgi:hypothetical protein